MTPDEQLAAAIYDGDSKSANAALRKGADPNGFVGRVPMIAAVAEDGNVTILRSLLQFGAQPERADTAGRTALHWASSFGRCKAVRLLLQSGAKSCANDRQGETPLHGAAMSHSVRAAELLLSFGANVNARNCHGRTPLHMTTICTDHAKMARALILGRADLEASDWLGRTPLHYAAFNGYAMTVRLLLSYGASADACDRNGRSAVHHGAASQDLNTLTLLLKQHPDTRAVDLHGNTPLHLAAPLGSPGIVQKLLAAGADLEAKNKCGKTALELTVAARRGCGGGAAVALLRAGAPSSDLGLFRLLRNAVRRAPYVKGSAALVCELVAHHISPASLTLQDYQVLLANSSRFKMVNGTSELCPATRQVVHALALHGCLLPPDLISEAL